MTAEPTIPRKLADLFGDLLTPAVTVLLQAGSADPVSIVSDTFGLDPEAAMGKLKRFKRVAFRCEKTAESYSVDSAKLKGIAALAEPIKLAELGHYAALVAFACSMILVKSVLTA